MKLLLRGHPGKYHNEPSNFMISEFQEAKDFHSSLGRGRWCLALNYIHKGHDRTGNEALCHTPTHTRSQDIVCVLKLWI